MKEGELLYKIESYTLVGCAYTVYNGIGYGHHERVYQRCYATELQESKFTFQEQVYHPVVHRGVLVGKYFFDFLVDNKIVVELKVGDIIYPEFVKQVLQYLRTSHIRLGIIILFSPTGVKFQRVVL